MQLKVWLGTLLGNTILPHAWDLGQPQREINFALAMESFLTLPKNELVMSPEVKKWTVPLSRKR
jgi:hypothetical protein